MDYGIRYAGKRDVSALCEIWRDCFDDPAEYIDYFYRENIDRISVVVCTENDRPVSVIHLFDAVFKNGGSELNAKLIYAAGTRSGYRRKGLMGKLLRYVTSEASRGGYALFLKPASPYLSRYYKGFGFETDAYFRLVTLNPGEDLPVSVSALTPEEYNRMRDAAFSDRPYAKWPDSHIRWCVDENEFCGGKTVAVRLNGESRFLMGSPRKDSFLITETDMSLSQLRQASGALCGFFGAAVLQAYLPDHSCREGKKIVSSLVYNAPLLNTYVNLILI